MRYRRWNKGKDQYAILRHLGVGDAFHASQYCIEQYDHTYEYACYDVYLKVSRKLPLPHASVQRYR